MTTKDIKAVKVEAGHYQIGTYTIKKTENDGWAIWDVVETEETGTLELAGLFDSAPTLQEAIKLVTVYIYNEEPKRNIATSKEEEKEISLCSTVYGAGRIYYNQNVSKYTYSRPGSKASIVRNICKGCRKYSIESIAKKSDSSTARIVDLLNWLQRKEGFCIEVLEGVVIPAGLVK